MLREAGGSRPGATVGVAPAVGRPGADGWIVRRRLIDALSNECRVVVVVAPPGYGKTVAVRQWAESHSDVPTRIAWLSVDLLDRTPTEFWRHVLEVLRPVVPSIDDEPRRLLDERAPGDPAFLRTLVAQIERSPEAVTFVVDDLAANLDRSVYDGLALIVERVGQTCRLVVTCRVDPPFPLVSWRAAGWFVDVREDQLRLSPDEAEQLAHALGAPWLSRDMVLALNDRVEGWPIGMHLALQAAQGSDDPEAAAAAVVRSDRILSDFLVTQVLDGLAENEVDVALGLAVVEWFDPELCRALLGTEALGVVNDLRRQHLFVTSIADRPGAARFHALVRELLERELHWRDPDRWALLHRAAADVWLERGDLDAVYRHLGAVGDRDRLHELLVGRALAFVDLGQRAAIVRMLSTLPRGFAVTDPHLALDLSVAWLFAGRGDESLRWCDQAEALMPLGPGVEGDRARATLEVRIHTMRAAVATMVGDLAAAAAHVEDFGRAMSNAGELGQMEDRFATIATRMFLASADLAGAAPWVERLAVIEEPPVVVEVTVAGLIGWYDLLRGRLALAAERLERSLTWVHEHECRPHHGVFDTLVTAGWCRLGSGDLAGAAALIDGALVDADGLVYPWGHARAGALRAELDRRVAGPAVSLRTLSTVRARLGDSLGRGLVHWLDEVEAAALLDIGRVPLAQVVIDRLPPGPARQLLRGRAALLGDRPGTATLSQVIGDHSAWPTQHHLSAELLLAAASRGATADNRMSAALVLGADTGWVSPFLVADAPVQAVLGRLPVAELHPQLAELRVGTRSDRPPPALAEPLTEREMMIVQLLPTHLSYAQMGERLFLSVNTIKSNLKAVYRKLDVSSRSEAVDAARAHSLL